MTGGIWGEATDNVAILAVLAHTPGILYSSLVYLWQEKKHIIIESHLLLYINAVKYFPNAT